MRRGFGAAIDRFTEAGSALYVADAAGALCLDHTTLPDAPAVLQGDGDVVEALARGTTRVDARRLATPLPGEWLFPMTVRGRLAGALLIGARDDGIAYRPEELRQIAASVRSMAMDLESLRAAELERRHDEMASRLDELATAHRMLEAENRALKGAPG